MSWLSVQPSSSFCDDDGGDDVYGDDVPIVRSSFHSALARHAFRATLRCDLTGGYARRPRRRLQHFSGDILDCVGRDVSAHLYAPRVFARSLVCESSQFSRVRLQMKLNLLDLHLLHLRQFDYHCDVCSDSVVVAHTGFHLLDPHDDVQMLRQPTNSGLLAEAS